MLAVYQIFKIIFGTIVSIFILYFLIQYSVNYSGSQKNIQKYNIIHTFLQDAENVYISGNPTNFSLSSRYDFSGCVPVLKESGLPNVLCSFGSIGPMRIPLLFYFRGKERLFMERKSVRYGFWDLYFVEAMPETRILFTPIDSSKKGWDLMVTITDNLPDTTNFSPKITFGFCNGETVDEFFCGGYGCEKPDFLGYLKLPHGGIHFSSCKADLSDRYRIVTISSACSSDLSKKGICIEPPDSDGTGYAYLSGSEKPYIYKDPADLIALIIGGNKIDFYGKPYGEILYEYKNKVFGERLSIASKVMSRRAVLISNNLPSGHKCSGVYSQLLSYLEDISETAESYSDLNKMKKLSRSVKSAFALEQKLMDMGCE